MKKIFIIILSILIVTTFTYLIIDEPIPEGSEGPKAEKLAELILTSINKPAWDSLESISWTYPIGNHHYNWNKKLNRVEVEWGEYKANINTTSGTGVVFENGVEIQNNKELIQKAFEYFYNDSFWLIAPYKIKDPGTIRKLVDYQGNDALLVQYTTGGATPGDSYLWIIDENYRPKAWKFWASIIPIGGMKFTWDEWKNIKGAQISTYHKGLIDIQIDDLK